MSKPSSHPVSAMRQALSCCMSEACYWKTLYHSVKLAISVGRAVAVKAEALTLWE